MRFVSDFFKKRPARRTKPDTADREEPERKASLHIVDSEHSNHYNYHHNTGPVWEGMTLGKKGSSLQNSNLCGKVLQPWLDSPQYLV